MASENIPQTNRSGSITYSASATDPNARLEQSSDTIAPAEGRRTSIAAVNPDSTHPAKDVDAPVNPSTESTPLNAHHRPSIQGDDHQGLTGDTTIRRASLAQNAPGRAGEIGEAAVGAIGFGGSTVERPKEDQGLGEKIANFLGA
jgi:hypothetical protein